MASKPEQKPKRTPIVLNMHLLDKEDDNKKSQDKKETKDTKVKPKEEKVEEKSKVNDVNVKEVKEVKQNEVVKENIPAAGKGKAGNVQNNAPQATKNGAAARVDGGNKDDRICRDFLRNMCNRGDNCKFYHPPPNEDAANRRRNSWLTLCHDFQNGQCIRSDCRYFHITREDETLYRTTGDIHPLVVDQVMRKALLLDIFRTGTRPPCKEFLRGSCDLATCRFRHLNRREYEDEVFRALQEEFEIVFGPPERRQTSPFNREMYAHTGYQDGAWYDRQQYDRQQYERPPYDSQPYDYRENLAPDDLRTTLLGRGEYEPEHKRRRYSEEGPYRHPDDYDAHRMWNERRDYEGRRDPNANAFEPERMLQEIANLRSEKEEIRRGMDDKILAMTNELNILTDENTNFRRENAMLRSTVNETDMSSKSTIEKLLMERDGLVADTRQIKTNLQKAEKETIDMKAMYDRKIGILENEKADLKSTFTKAKDAEQKLKEELQKAKNEKEALIKDKNNLQAELQKAKQNAANKVGQAGQTGQTGQTGQGGPMAGRKDFPKQDVNSTEGNRNTPNQNRMGSGFQRGDNKNENDRNMPDRNMPDRNMPDRNMPNRNMPNRNMPDRNMPDRNMPNRNMPDRNMPNRNMSDRNMPDRNMPDRNMSDRNMPDRNMSDRNMPDRNMPDRNMPDRNMSDRNMPDRNMPNRNMPDRNMPNQDRMGGGRMGPGMRGMNMQQDFGGPNAQNDMSRRNMGNQDRFGGDNRGDNRDHRGDFRGDTRGDFRGDNRGDNRGSNMRGFGNENDNRSRMDWSQNSWGNQQQGNDRQPRSDWSQNSWGNQQQNKDRQTMSEWLQTESPDQSSGQWRSSANDKSRSSQPQSLLGEYQKPESLLGEYPSGAGPNVVRGLSEFGQKGHGGQQPDMKPDHSKMPSQSGGSFRSSNDDQYNRDFMGSNRGSNMGSNMGSSMGSNMGSNMGSDMGSGMGSRSRFEDRDYGLSGYDNDIRAGFLRSPPRPPTYFREGDNNAASQRRPPRPNWY